MTKRIAILQGHPDASTQHLCHALAQAYAEGAQAAGHEVRIIDVAQLDFPVLRSHADWDGGTLPPSLADGVQTLRWAEHVVLFFPLWLGDMPALLKAYLEQISRDALSFERTNGTPKMLAGRTARIVATMGMPAVVYRWYFRAHSVRALERNILGFFGVSPVHETLIGSVAGLDERAKTKWFSKLRGLGKRGG